MSNIRRKHSPAFKAQVAVSAIKELQTLSQIAGEFSLHTTQIRTWRDKLLKSAPEVFKDGKQQKEIDKDKLIDELYRQLGEKTVELDWLKKKLQPFSR